MKLKRIALLAIMMVAVLSANAQYEPGKWGMHIKFGYGASLLSDLDKMPLVAGSADDEAIGARVVGMDFEYQASSLIGLSVGLTHVWQGGGWKDIDMGNNMKAREPHVSLEYVTMPFIANFYVYKGLALKTGLELSYLSEAKCSMKTKEVFEGRDKTIKTTLDVEDDCNKFDLSIPIGVSYEFKSHFVLDARFNLGLLKVNDSNIFGDKDIKNSSLMFTFGYKFDL